MNHLHASRCFAFASFSMNTEGFYSTIMFHSYKYSLAHVCLHIAIKSNYVVSRLFWQHYLSYIFSESCRNGAELNTFTCCSMQIGWHGCCNLLVTPVNFSVVNIAYFLKSFLDYLVRYTFEMCHAAKLWRHLLTHWGRDKMVAIYQTSFSNAFSWKNIFGFRLRFHWHFLPQGTISDIPELVQIMAWRRPGEKPLFEPMMVILLRHSSPMSLTWPLYLKTNSVKNEVIYWTRNLL